MYEKPLWRLRLRTLNAPPFESLGSTFAMRADRGPTGDAGSWEDSPAGKGISCIGVRDMALEG